MFFDAPFRALESSDLRFSRELPRRLPSVKPLADEKLHCKLNKNSSGNTITDHELFC